MTAPLHERMSPDDLLDLLRRRRAARVPVKTIAAEIGMGTSTLEAMLHRVGLTRPREERMALRQQRADKAVQLRLEGRTCREIGTALGIGRSTVEAMLTERGLSIDRLTPEQRDRIRDRLRSAAAASEGRCKGDVVQIIVQAGTLPPPHTTAPRSVFELGGAPR